MKLTKYAGNPILSPDPHSTWDALQVRNPAVIMHEGKIKMLYTAAQEKEVTHTLCLGLAESSDGFNFERVSDKPAIAPSIDEFDGFDAGGLEDARVVKIDDIYYITYAARAVAWTAFHVHGIRRDDIPSNGATWTKNLRRGGLLTTKDFKTFTRRGPITSEDFYECNLILFPEKINGKFVLMHRPSSDLPYGDNAAISIGANIAFTEDFKNYEKDTLFLKQKFDWENSKVGGSAPPIKTEYGWLAFYHTVEITKAIKPFAPKKIYRTGLMLLDLEDPTKIIARVPHPVLEPEYSYELFGSVPNVVFPTGNIVIDDELFIYYGAADTVIGVATVKLQKLLDYVLKFRIK